MFQYIYFLAMSQVLNDKVTRIELFVRLLNLPQSHGSDVKRRRFFNPDVLFRVLILIWLLGNKKLKKHLRPSVLISLERFRWRIFSRRDIHMEMPSKHSFTKHLLWHRHAYGFLPLEASSHNPCFPLSFRMTYAQTTKCFLLVSILIALEHLFIQQTLYIDSY